MPAILKTFATFPRTPRVDSVEKRGQNLKTARQNMNSRVLMPRPHYCWRTM